MKLEKDTPDIVPDKLENPLDYRVFILILGIAVFIQIAFINLGEESVGNLAFVISLGSSLAVACASLIISKRYWKSLVFGKAYLALSFGYFSYFIAEILYYTFDLILGIQAYPSVADIFFFALYPFTLTHLILNIRFFTSTFSLASKMYIPSIPVLFLFIYVYLSLLSLDSPNFDFYYGLIFVAAASTTLSFAIYGLTIFKQGVIGIAWFLLVVGVFINAVADLWYYNLEIFGQYYDAHPVTVLWFAANFIMIYALYKHQKSI